MEVVAMMTAVVLLGAGVAPEHAATRFEAMGFQTETMVGGALTITGSEDMFETGFGAPMTGYSQGGTALPLEALPEDLKSDVQAIEFQRPLDFGPTDY